MADLQNNTRHISLFKAIVLVAIVVVQVVRLSGTSFVLYYQFHTLVISVRVLLHVIFFQAKKIKFRTSYDNRYHGLAASRSGYGTDPS